MVQTILVSGKWNFYENKWKIDADGRGSRVIGIHHHFSFNGLVETVFEDYRVDKMDYEVELSYMFPKEVLLSLEKSTPPAIVVNDRQLKSFIEMFGDKSSKLCVTFLKAGTNSLKKFARSSTSNKDNDDKKNSEGDDESEDEKVFFDCCDDSDGFSSGDEDYNLYEREVKLEVEKTKPKKKKPFGQVVEDSVAGANYREIEVRALDIAVGQRYDSKEALLLRLKILALAKKFDFNRVESRPDILVVKCWVEKCTWRVRATAVGQSPSFYIKAYNDEHSCSFAERGGRCRQASSQVLGKLYFDCVGSIGPNIIPDSVAVALNFRFGIQIDYWKAHRALAYACFLAHGSHENGYKELPTYLYLIKRANPGTYTRLAVDQEGRFKALFISFGASINGLQYMRKVVVVDGTHLKGTYKGTLLVATCQDGNFNIFPIAFAVVDTENDESWEWFFTQLSNVVRDEADLSIISDRHKSIAKAIEKVYPLACRGICTYHMYKNILTKFKGGEAFRLVKKAATAYTISDFNIVFNEILDINPALHAYLEKADVKVWSRAHFPGNRYNILTSNIAESINRVLRDARCLPIVKLLDAIRSMLTRWFTERRRGAELMSTHLTAAVEKLLEPRLVEARLLTVQEVDRDKVHVTNGKHSAIVDVCLRQCSCRRFDVHDMPCVHAIAAGTLKEMNLIRLTSPYYYKSYLVNAYAQAIILRDVAHPVPQLVAGQQCDPPPIRQPPGRPKKSRCKSAMEKATEKKFLRKQVICSKCNKSGHNCRTCGR